VRSKAVLRYLIRILDKCYRISVQETMESHAHTDVFLFFLRLDLVRFSPSRTNALLRLKVLFFPFRMAVRIKVEK